MPIPRESSFTSRLRTPAVSARIGRWLGIAFTIAFLTGLVSHWAQAQTWWIPYPTAPSWGYRLTQGLHLVSGTACVPLLLVKLWTVFPKLFQAMPKPFSREGVLTVLERGSIAVLVAAAIFQLASGLSNSAQWYPWGFSFRPTHYAVAWLAIGALALHVAVKLPVIRQALGSDVEDDALNRPGTQATSAGLTRRGLLRTTWVATGVAVLATAGATVTPLRRISLLAVRNGKGPQGLPVNRSAEAAGATDAAQDPAFRLTIAHGDRTVELSRDDLAALPQQTRTLPIACVEGWSASATWTGVPVRDLLDLVDAPASSDISVQSLQTRGAFARTTLQGSFSDDPDTLLALQVDGEDLDLDHGFPCRLIAPNRPGVLQTKWVHRLEVIA
ncbi:molybdopterin-dependent oxidoreductase [Nocardioides sp. CBS4Y-1]|uniref:Molybdopterin-dependent oxidoreductase n=1 Tax=Nocardioides acrostichi TaxID=2784339 RepID=A0A930Y9B5_9ACTN|nr:molybdopterin-dependent oxidoreductase [Nocardioides acrostichi]